MTLPFEAVECYMANMTPLQGRYILVDSMWLDLTVLNLICENEYLGIINSFFKGKLNVLSTISST